MALSKPPTAKYEPLQDALEEETAELILPRPSDDYSLGTTPGPRAHSLSALMTISSHIVLLICGIFVGVLLSITLSETAGKTCPAEVTTPESLTPNPAAATKVEDGIVWAGTQCGDSWQEAEARGCHFDVMASRWYSPECFDGEALEEMLQEPQINYTWFADPRHTTELEPGSVMAGQFEKIYPLYDFHIGHCLYLWRRLHRAVIYNRPLDDELFSYEHTVHCTRLILRWKEPWSTVTFQTSGRPFCRSDRLGYISP